MTQPTPPPSGCQPQDCCGDPSAHLPAVPQSPVSGADRAALRDRIRRAICEADGFDFNDESIAFDDYAVHADAVLAVFFGPIPAGTDTATWTAIRATQLMNEAGRQRDRYRSAWCSARERAQAYCEGILRVVKDREAYQEWLRQAEESNVALLRRLAGEAQQDVCRRTQGLSGEYPPCTRPAGHQEAYCRSADSKAYFLAVDGPAPAREAQPDEADAATTEHHTVDGTRYLCHTGDHYCPSEARQDPAPGGEARTPFIPAAHYRGRDGTVYCVHATPVGPDSCSECRDLADEEQPAAVARSGQPTAYSDGKGHTYCLPCAPQVGADVPLNPDDVDHWELCPSCGRHVVDVARSGQPETNGDATEAAAVPLATTCASCGHRFDEHNRFGCCVGNQEVRCGCETFVTGEKPAPVDPWTILGIDAAPDAPTTTGGEALVHVGWWCWRGDNHGHLATMACRSDNVPIHVPAEWADEMRAVIQRIEDGDEPETPAS